MVRIKKTLFGKIALPAARLAEKVPGWTPSLARRFLAGSIVTVPENCIPVLYEVAGLGTLGSGRFFNLQHRASRADLWQVIGETGAKGKDILNILHKRDRQTIANALQDPGLTGLTKKDLALIRLRLKAS
jgi:hypothetical protein